MRLLIVAVILVFSMAPRAHAEESSTKELTFDTVKQQPSWNNFSLVMQQQEEKDSVNGLSYIISGGIAITGGLIGYYSSDDIFAKAVYSIAQTVGIAAVGYGAYTMSLGDDHRTFYQTVKDIRSLSPQQKDDLVKGYFNLEQKRERKARTIKAVTYGLVALLNGYNAITANQNDLKTALFFVAGVNALASISFAF